MIVPEEILKSITQEVIDKYLIPKYRELGLKASGNWEKELEVRVNNGYAEIWGAGYTEQLVNGRVGGKLTPPRQLEKWVQLKMGVSPDKAKSVAWAVAKKIQKEGTEIHKKGGTDLLEVLNSPECINYIQERLGEELRPIIKVEVQRKFKEALGKIK